MELGGAAITHVTDLFQLNGFSEERRIKQRKRLPPDTPAGIWARTDRKGNDIYVVPVRKADGYRSFKQFPSLDEAIAGYHAPVDSDVEAQGAGQDEAESVGEAALADEAAEGEAAAIEANVVDVDDDEASDHPSCSLEDENREPAIEM